MRRRRIALAAFLTVVGPGVITGFAGNEAGGVTTYSSVGALFGFSLLWLLLIASIGLGVIQVTVRRRDPQIASRLGLERTAGSFARGEQLRRCQLFLRAMARSSASFLNFERPAIPSFFASL